MLSNNSVARVSREALGPGWLDSLSRRLADTSNREDAAAALAELRAYGSLLEAGFSVKPEPTTTQPTPEFTVDAGDGEVAVEVFAKHQDDDQKQQLVDAGAGKYSGKTDVAVVKTERGKVTMATTVLHPGGAPDPKKPHDSTQANLISRICAVKAEEKQLPSGRPSLVWIDFQGFGIWPESLRLDQAGPLISGRDGLVSGAFWYAFYGWKGAPIFEEDFPLHERIVPMGHDGRFRLDGKKKSKLSGAVLVIHEGLILFENPWGYHSLPERARRHCERLPWFDMGRSICNWSQDDALTAVLLGERQIRAMETWRQVLSPP